jgi:hypothetical protein
MEPLLPPEGTRVLEDLAVELASVAAALAGKLSEETVCAVSTLVRSMNCYYSNLIEGHQTHPVDIERALKGDYSSEPHIRRSDVLVGAHLAPVASELDGFMRLFEDHYRVDGLSRVMQIVAVAASHHRLLWIHPFLDGNGRVARLFSHAFLKSLGVGNALWSVSRGLARNVSEYKARLADADSWREGDTDGRGSLSQRGLIEFCEFFLKVCIDQVRFMTQILEPSGLLDRVRRYCAEQVERKVMPKGSFEVLREVILLGALPRAKVTEVTGYKERQARSIVTAQQFLKSFACVLG